MKRLLITLLGCILALGLWAKGAPEIEFTETRHDFGNLRRDGGVVEYDFTYKNTGTAPLALTTVSAPCGCTKVKYSHKPLAPGKSAKIHVTFDPKTKQGEFLSTISVWTNVKLPDGKKKKVVLHVSGVAIPNT